MSAPDVAAGFSPPTHLADELIDESKVTAALESPDADVLLVTLKNLTQRSNVSSPILRKLALNLVYDRRGSRELIQQVLKQAGARSVPAVSSLASLESEKAKVEALAMFEILGDQAAAAIPLMARLADDEAKSVRCRALDALGATRNQAAVPHLMRFLDNPDGDLKWYAAQGLSNIGPSAKEAIPTLHKLARHIIDRGSDPNQMHEEVLLALTRIGPAAAPAMVEIASDIKNPTDVRVAYLKGLGEMIPHPRAALPGLTDALRDKSDAVRETAVRSLREFGSVAKQTIPGLTDSLRDKSYGVRIQAAATILVMSPQDKTAFNTLLECLRVNDIAAKCNACDEIARLGESAESAIPEIEKCLKDSSARVRESAAFALGEFGFLARSAEASLIEHRFDPDQSVQDAVERALKALRGRRRLEPHKDQA
jgi:HEAT repeat protein